MIEESDLVTCKKERGIPADHMLNMNENVM